MKLGTPENFWTFCMKMVHFDAFYMLFGTTTTTTTTTTTVLQPSGLCLELPRWANTREVYLYYFFVIIMIIVYYQPKLPALVLDVVYSCTCFHVAWYCVCVSVTWRALQKMAELVRMPLGSRLEWAKEPFINVPWHVGGTCWIWLNNPCSVPTQVVTTVTVATYYDYS